MLIILEYLVGGIVLIFIVAFVICMILLLIGMPLYLFGKEKKEKSWIDCIPDEIIITIERETPKPHEEPTPCQEAGAVAGNESDPRQPGSVTSAKSWHQEDPDSM